MNDMLYFSALIPRLIHILNVHFMHCFLNLLMLNDGLNPLAFSVRFS